MMTPISLDKISAEDIQKLVASGHWEEGLQVEFKSKLPSGKESEKTPLLLKPVCAFANAEGGDLIFGIDAQDGIATKIKGVECDNADNEVLRLSQFVQGGVEPQLFGMTIQPISISKGKYVFIVRVQKSWISPHRVRANSVFYARSSSGTTELDVSQLRATFQTEGKLVAGFEKLQARRIAQIQSGAMPVRLAEGAMTILHVAPVLSLASSLTIPSASMQALQVKIGPSCGGMSSRYTYEGMMVFAQDHECRADAYSHLFRNGVFEFVKVYCQNKGKISSKEYEWDLCYDIDVSLKAFSTLGISPPYWVSLALVGVRAWGLTRSADVGVARHSGAFERDSYVIQGPAIETLDVTPPDVMRSVFDVVWNCVGFPRSDNWDDRNEWRWK